MISNYKNIQLDLKNQSFLPTYAVMTASTINLGDDIQTLAAINFLKKKGITEYIFIDREKLSDYNGQEVKLIMNGWFMHNLNKFPPSDKIRPIFISMHINDENIIKKNVAYFKKNQPVGCRDTHTVQLFKKYDIEAYFTGCLTLYFDEHFEKGPDKYMVDINLTGATLAATAPLASLPSLASAPGNAFKKVKHLENKKDILNNIQNRLEKAQKLLDDYKCADLVITSRLHCILPCRAFNTRAIFIFPKYKIDPRFRGLEPFIGGSTRPHCIDNVNRDVIKDIKQSFDNFILI